MKPAAKRTLRWGLALAALLIPRNARADALVGELERSPATREAARSVARGVGRRALAHRLGEEGAGFLRDGRIARGGGHE